VQVLPLFVHGENQGSSPLATALDLANGSIPGDWHRDVENYQSGVVLRSCRSGASSASPIDGQSRFLAHIRGNPDRT